MNNKTQNMETRNKNANPQLASENNLINNLGEQLLSEIMVKETKNETTDEVKATDVNVYSKNAFQSSLAHEFEKLKQKVVEEMPSALEIQDYSIPNANGMELLNDEAEEIPKLIDPIFHRVGLASLIGSSDTGKSSFLRDLCVHIVTGMDFLGWKVNPIHKRAYYVSTEDDQMAISFLLKKQNKDYGLIPEDLENLVYIFETDNLVDRLNKELCEKPADVVVVDAFADVFNGQLYETNRVRAFLNEFSQLAQKHQCLIIFLHHTNKRSDTLEPSKHNALGSQGFEAKMRLMIELKSDTQINNQKHFCIVKGNYLSNQYKTHSFNLQFTENLTFNNLNTRTHYDLITQTKERMETIEYEYAEIMKLKDEGLSHKEVGLELGMSDATVSRKISKYKKLKALEKSNHK